MHAPAHADVLWYSLRNSIECSYRDIKSDGWQWHKTRLTSPNRAERLWLAIAVATLWVVTVGGESDAHPPDTLDNQPSSHHLVEKPTLIQTTTRQISCFLQGLLIILAAKLNGKSICLNGLFPFQKTLSPPIAVNSS